MIRLVGLLAVAVLAAACQGPPAAPPRSSAPLVDHAAEARLAMTRRDWSAAATHYRAALEAQPERLEFHYGLAIASSYLDDREETRREFEWVLAHARAGSDEARTARSWLAQAGLIGADDGGTAASPDTSLATVSGTVTWPEGGGSPVPRPRHLLMLVGLPGTPTEGQYYRIRSREDGRYEFPDVVPGPYKLTDRVAGPPFWRLKVVVEPGQRMTLDLSPANGAQVRDDFPDQPRSG